jgi:hypothetical protein
LRDSWNGLAITNGRHLSAEVFFSQSVPPSVAPLQLLVTGQVQNNGSTGDGQGYRVFERVIVRAKASQDNKLCDTSMGTTGLTSVSRGDHLHEHPW